MKPALCALLGAPALACSAQPRSTERALADDPATVPGWSTTYLGKRACWALLGAVLLAEVGGQPRVRELAPLGSGRAGWQWGTQNQAGWWVLRPAIGTNETPHPAAGSGVATGPHNTDVIAARCCATRSRTPQQTRQPRRPPDRTLIMTFTRTLIAAALIASGSAALAQANIHQDSATAGNVTPGDAPGFPITISQPGSYRLTSNLFVPSGKSGIVITAPDVTLDLNGFTLSGTVACTQNYSSKAITCTGVVAGSTHGITTGARSVIKNGTVKGFSHHGVFAMGGAETIERVTAVHNGANGIHQETWTGLWIADSLMILNRYNGAETRHSLITGSRFISNGNRGLHGREEVTLVLDSVAFDNADIGIFGTTANRTIANGNPLNVGAQFSLGVKMNKQGNYIAY